MRYKRKYRIEKVTVQGELLRGEARIAGVRCTFNDVRESIIAESLGGGGPEELPDLLHDFRNGYMEILEGGSDLDMIEDLVLALSSGERWLVQVSRNEIFGRVGWEIRYLSVLQED